MSQFMTASWWRKRLPDLSAAISRFPLAVALAAAFTLYALTLDDVTDVPLRILQFLAASYLWAVAVDFFAESQGHAFHARALLWFGGVLVLALLFWLTWDIWLMPPLLLGGLALLVPVAGHLRRGETNETFWLFNHRLWLAVLLAGVGSVLLLAGLLAIIGTLDFLFSFPEKAYQEKLYQYAWTISLGFIAPVSALAFAPKSFTDRITPREESEFTVRAVAAVVKFVLVPLLLVYTAILYAYAAKIALAWQLPKGTLGAMVTAYLLVGAVTLLLGYPIRESGGALVRFFWRYWMWLVALPVLLLFIAVFRRVGDYGMTPSRYLVVLVGIWALILAGLRIWRGRNLDLRLVPGILAGLLLAASFGPGGAIGFSVMSQKAELGEILTKHGILSDGKIAAGSAEAGKDLPAEEAARVRAIEWYLNTHRALGLLAPWFVGTPDNPFAEGKTPDETARGVLEAFGFGGVDISQPPESLYLNHYAELPLALDIPQGTHLVGPLMSQAATRIEPESVAVAGLGTVQFAIDGKVLTVHLESGGGVTFDLYGAVKEIKSKGWPADPERKPVELKGKGNGLDGTLLIENMTGNYRDPVFQLLTLRFWVLLAKPQ